MFQQNLGNLLRRTAEAIPSSTDLTSRVESQIRQQNSQGAYNVKHLSNQSIGSLCALLAIVIIGGLLLHSRSQTANISTNPLKPGLIGNTLPSIDQGITVQVLYVYADPISTTVQAAISGVQLFDPSLLDPTLTDNKGHSFAFDAAGSIYTDTDPTNVTGIFKFLPLPTSMLHQALRLTFSAHNITSVNKKPPVAAGDATKKGDWSIPFTVNPVAGITHQLHLSAIFNQGIGVQIQSIEIAPTTQTNMGQQGGIRILLTVSGLPSEMLLQSFYGWQPTDSPNPTTRGGALCTTVSTCIQSVPTSAVLTFPGFTANTQGRNGITVPLDSQFQSQAQTIGPSGTIQVELLYPGQGIPSGTGTLTVANLHVLVSGSVQPSIKSTLPPWHLTLPLS